MKYVSLLGLLLLFSCGNDSQDNEVSVLINEWVVQNRSTTIVDADGKQEDWVEIYNAGSASVNLRDYYLADKRDSVTRYRFEGVELQPGEFHIVWGGIGEFHPAAHLGFGFSLSGDKSEGIFLFDSTGVIIDSVDIKKVTAENDCDTCAYGRIPDGALYFSLEQKASPGNSNNYGK